MSESRLRTIWLALALIGPFLNEIGTAAPAADIETFPRPASLRELLALPDGQIDVGYGALLVEQSLFRRSRPGRLAARIDGLAREVAPRIAARTTARGKLRTLAWHLFVKHRFGTDGVGSSGRAHAFTATLGRRRGVCFGLSILYTAVAQRLRLPVRLVEIPGHVFVRYDDGRDVVNLETTRRGQRKSTRYYLEEYGLSQDRYVRVLSPRESIALCLLQTAGAMFEIGQVDRGRKAIERALEIDPGNPRAWYKMGLVHEASAERTEESDAYRRSLSLRADDPVVWAALAVAQQEDGDRKAAARSFRAMAAVEARSPAVWILTGDALARDGVVARAVDCYRRALRRNESVRRDAERLSRCVDRAIAATAENEGAGDDVAAARVRLAAALFSLGRQGETVRVLRDAPKRSATIVRCYRRALDEHAIDEPSFWIFAALTAGAIGDRKDSVRCLQEATRRGAVVSGR